MATESPIQFGQSSRTAPGGRPSCQPQRHPQVATHRVDASDAPFTPPALHISPVFVLGEHRRSSASFPGLSTASPAKLSRTELRLDVLYLDLHLFPLAEHW